MIKLKVRYIGEKNIDTPNSYKIFIDVVPNKTYEVLSVNGDWCRIIDESGEDYLYPLEKFEIVDFETAGSVAV